MVYAITAAHQQVINIHVLYFPRLIDILYFTWIIDRLNISSEVLTIWIVT